MVPPQEDAKSGSFNTTPWSLLFAALHGGSATEAQKALGQLCEIYWKPIFLFIRQSGHGLYETQDLTLRFLVYLIDREAFAKADRAKGKFAIGNSAHPFEKHLPHIKRCSSNLRGAVFLTAANGYRGMRQYRFSVLSLHLDLLSPPPSAGE